MKEINIHKVEECDLEWLIGFFYADGSKYKDRRTYTISLYLNPKKDKNILKRLRRILKKMNVNYCIQNKKGALCIKTTCKRFFEIFPKKSLKYTPKNIDAFIAGFLDGDGYVSPKEYKIGFSQKNVKWIGPYISNYLITKDIKPWRNNIYRDTFYYSTSLKKVKERTNILNIMSESTRCQPKQFGH